MRLRLIPLLIGIVLMLIGGVMTKHALNHTSSRNIVRNHVSELGVFVVGIFFVTKAVFPGEDDDD